jgi:hypothetical protein
MTTPPPDDLKRWSKNALVREVQRLRAITREHAERRGDDPREHALSGPAVTDVAGDPYAQGGAILDARAAVLLDEMDVVLVDTKHDEPVAMLLSLQGRVNYSHDRAEHAYLFGADGASALVSEVVGLATRASKSAGEHGQRFAVEFRKLLSERMDALP